MTIKSKKIRSQNKLYFLADYSPEETENNKKFGYELKCHLIDSPEPYGNSTEYILHDLQLDDETEALNWITLRYLHREDKSQVLVVSIVFPPDGDFIIYSIILHCGQSDASNTKFRIQACDSVREILQLVLNRKKGIHCDTCAYKFKQRLSGKCNDLYELNRFQNEAG